MKKGESGNDLTVLLMCGLYNKKLPKHLVSV